MSQQHPLDTITPPLLDRLIDDKSLTHKNSAFNTQAQQIQRVTENIRQNIELILNTRLRFLDWPSNKNELRQSIVNYGLPDFTHSYFGNKQTQNLLLNEIREKISIFEPRLKDISIIFLDNDVEIERILRLRIDATIEFELSSLPTSYESVIDINSHQFRLEAAS